MQRAVTEAAEPQTRRRPRHPLHLRVELPQGTGVTRNVSVNGVYFVTNARTVVAGEPLDFTLVLDHLGTLLPWRLECTGTVLRVEPRGEIIGVAATIDAFQISS